MKTMLALFTTGAVAAACAHGAGAAPRSLTPTPAGTPTIELVSVADLACDGGFGFRRVDAGARGPAGAFVVPDGAVFVASEIRWNARADAFASPADRVVLEVADADADASGPRAVVNGTRVAAGEAEGGRRYRTGVAFDPGTTLCGHVRTRNGFAEARPASAGAVIRGHLVDARARIARRSAP